MKKMDGFLSFRPHLIRLLTASLLLALPPAAATATSSSFPTQTASLAATSVASPNSPVTAGLPKLLAQQTAPPSRQTAARPGRQPAQAGAAIRSLTINDASGTPRQIRFTPPPSPRLPQTAAADPKAADLGLIGDFLAANGQLLRLRDPAAELALASYEKDPLGFRHVRYRQVFRGIPVWPAEVTFHVGTHGFLDSMDGFSVPTPRKVVTQPVFGPHAAEEKARNEVPEGGSGEVSSQELIIFAYDGRNPRLAWKIRLLVSPLSDWLVVVDALNGNILMAHNTVTNGTNAVGTGSDLLGQQQNFNVWENNGTYYLIDASKDMYDPTSTLPDINKTKGAFFVVTARNQPPTDNIESLPDLFHITSTSLTSGWDTAGVGVASALSRTYDYYNQAFGWKSFDGKGGTLTAIVHIGQNYFNAAMAASISTMIYGDADLFAVPDIIAHEFQHGVTANTARLVYQDQSGALNEAFSDIFGEMVESYIRGSNDWVIGSDMNNTTFDARRSLKNPHDFDADPGPGVSPYPATMAEYLQTTSDKGGVHTNNTIVTHAFYLLAAGLPGAIGKQDAAAVFFRALRYHLTPNSQFIDARLATIASAEEIFASDTARRDTVVARIREAFDQVGITDAAATPPPPAHTPVQGSDAALFVTDYDPYWGYLYDYYLGRCELVQGSYECITLTYNPVATSRPAVSGDGSEAIFVDAYNDLCSVATDGSAWETCLGYPGSVSSVAMAPDGSRWAFVLIDPTTGSPDNTITLLTRQNDGSWADQTIVLQAPIFDGVSVDAVLHADSMDFSTDGRLLYYDALNVLRTPDGQQQAVWSIYALDVASGRIFGVLPPVPGKDIGYPAVAQTNDFQLTFDLYDSSTNQSTVMAADLSSGVVKEIATVNGWGVPGYNGDDTYLFYTKNDSEIWSVPVAADHLTVSGAEGQELTNASFGVVYRRGTFVTPVPQIGASAASLAFPDTASGSIATLPLTLSNTGNADLNIGQITVSGAQSSEFQLNPGNCAGVLLRPNAGCQLFLAFTPASTGQKSANLQVSSNDPATPTLAVPLSGTGVAPVTWNISISSEGQGSTTPTGTVAVTAGGDLAVTFTPAAGYHVSEVRVDGTSIGAAPSYTFTNVTTDHSLHVVFAADALPRHTITVTSSGNGTVLPGGPVTADQGSNLTFSFLPAAGSHVADVLVDSVSVGAKTGHTFTAVSADHALQVIFAADVLTRKGDVNGDGHLTLTDPLAVLRLLTGQAPGPLTTGADVNGDRVIGLGEAIFALERNETIAALTHVISATAGSGGTIFPAGTVTVADGAAQQFLISPDNGYHIETFTVDGNPVAVQQTYTFAVVKGDHAIAVTFARDISPPSQYPVSAAAGAGGTISPAGTVSVAAGGSQQFLFTPGNGFEVADVVVNGQSVGKLAQYTFTNVQAAGSITVTFKQINVPVTTDIAYMLNAAAGGRYDAETLLEELLDIAVRAIWYASEQAGSVVFHGTLTQIGDTMNFTWQATPTGKLVIAFSNGNGFEITTGADRFSGFTNGTADDFLLSHAVDFTIVSNTGINLRVVSNTWPTDNNDPIYSQKTINWQRRMTGSYPDGERIFALDINSGGKLLRSDPSANYVFSKRQSTLTGTASSPGFSIAIDESFSSSVSHDSYANSEVKEYLVTNDSRITGGSDTYQFNNVHAHWIQASAFNEVTSTAGFLVHESEKWYAGGQISQNGQVYGTVGFDSQPVNKSKGPAVVLTTATATTELFRPIPQ